MAEFRNIHTRIWKDEWFSELPTDAKLLFIYLFSNERASVCGMYELPIKFMAFETGLEAARIIELLAEFQASAKVYYRDGVVWVVNLRKYNETSSGKVFGRIVKDIEGIPDGWVKEQYCKAYSIPYRYPIDTSPQPLDTHPENSSETETETLLRETETETETETRAASSPELELYREVTGGLLPDYMHEEEVKRGIHAIRIRLKNPPRDILKEYLLRKFREWCSCKTQDGRPYNPSNPKWLDWGITDFSPKPAVPPQAIKMRKLTDAHGNIIEVPA